MDKIGFPKTTETLQCSDLGIEDAPGVVFTFWNNPSKAVVIAISDVVMAAVDELRSMDKIQMADLESRYYSALCELIVDCNVESLVFDTPQNAMKSFEAEDVPMGFVHQVVASYLAHLLKFNKNVKKALALYLVGSAFGRDSAVRDDE